MFLIGFMKFTHTVYGCSTVHYSHKAVAFSVIAAFDNIKHCVPTAEDSLLGDKEGK